MRATAESTAAYHLRHPGLHTSILGRTGLTVSGAGFGGYRIAAGVAAHRIALRDAVASGINLIDTSANYADGGSEELIGETIAELVRDGLLSRNELVLVTKGGYIQGSNYEMARERVAAGSGFPEVVEYGEGLWHCIAPEFLADQITRSLERLDLPSVDVYLLHNPEYYLNWAKNAGLPPEEARSEYYRRIRNAFAYLETEVERGRIGCYGVSSNSFVSPSTAYDFTSLEEIVKIAEKLSLVHNFKVIQFPANIFESGFVREQNQSGGRTLIELAREKNLGTLVNRPLNAIRRGTLMRLADFPGADTYTGPEPIRQGISRLKEMEDRFASEQVEAFTDDDEGRSMLLTFIAVGGTMEKYWQTFGSIEHYNDVLSQHFAPRLAHASQYVRQHCMQSQVDWFNSYLADARALFQAVGGFYAASAGARSRRIRERLGAALGGDRPGTLSSLAIRLLLGVPGIDTVLVGMRREEYTADVLRALHEGPAGDDETWRKLDLSGIDMAGEGG